jgi:hypothetical protein
VVLARASIVTPGDWTELDLNPATRHTSISQLVRRPGVSSRGWAPDAVPIIALLDRASRRVADAGAFYCAWHLAKDPSGNTVVLTALMQVRSATVPPPPDAHSGVSIVSVGERCAALADVVRGDSLWAGADVRVVKLPFTGSAVRLRIEDGGVIVQYLVPLVNGSAVVVLTFSCPFPPYARVVTELFDAMAQSLVLHYE